MLRFSGWTIFGLGLLAIPPMAGASRVPTIANQVSKVAKADDLDTIMKKKLSRAQKALEGLALNDFGKIQTNADELIELSKQAEWMVIRTPEYELNTDSFRRSAQDLGKSAKDKNVDGAALAYVELTMNCVKCHKYVRDTRRTQLMPSSERAFAAQAATRMHRDF
jgi:hypothetical protein